MPAPSQAPRLVERKGGTFVNWHETLRASLAARFELHNPQTPPSLSAYAATARELQQLCSRARQAGVRLRALGSGWSFSDAAATDGWQLNTAYLNWLFRFDAHALSPAWAPRAASLVLAQCGVSIHELNAYLERDKQRSLRTSGASNGQTIAGAIATDTHGSAIDQGPLGSQVRALHLVTASRQLWIERPSDPVLESTLLAGHGFEVVRDDASFDAALVGLGSLGVVHGVLLETAERFMLNARQARLAFDEPLRTAMRTLDFSSLAYAQRPYFFQAVVIPHAKIPEAYVKAMDVIPFEPGHEIDYAVKPKTAAGYDLPGTIGRLLDVAPGLTPAVVRALVKSELKEFQDKKGTWGEIFDFTAPRAKAAGAALGVPLARCVEALDLARAAFDEAGGAPLVFGCRYVAHSPALLSIAHFAPVTAVIDLDGVLSKRTLALMERVRARFEAAGMPYTQHWGKLCELTPARVRASHGAGVDEWRRVRRALLSKSERALFSNPLLERAGLHEA